METSASFEARYAPSLYPTDFRFRALGAVWVIMLLVIVGYWFYHGIMTPPPG